ncbi:MAG TPA: hypothetical protein VJP83_17270 [Terriglobales bacterium]|nr:hypothetical protein [Terriglobales bacterium]
MRARASIRKGLTALAEQPALPLAEIAWRWCFAAAAATLAAVTVLEYLNSIPVSWGERLLLESEQPLLALAAVAHALRGSAARFAAGAVVAGTAGAILWMLFAALGRLVTLQALLPQARVAYRPLLGLSFLRAGLFLAAVLAGLGSFILAGFAGSPGDAAPSVVLAAVLIACIWLVWALLNWLLSVAAIFVVRDRQDTFGAIAAAAGLVRRQFGEVVLTSLPFVLLHYLALAAAIASGVLVFDVMARVSPQAGWALMVIPAGYFAYADFLYITRLAAYVELAEPGGEVAMRPFPENLPHREASPPSSGMKAQDHCEPVPPAETAEAGIERA